MKDGPEGARIISHLESTEVGADEDGDAITNCVVVPVEECPARVTARPNLTKSAQIALRGLTQALAEHGERAPASNHIPAGARVTTVDRWRENAYRLGITTSEKPRARQMAFQRASDALIAANVIGVWEPYVWSTCDAPGEANKRTVL